MVAPEDLASKKTNGDGSVGDEVVGSASGIASSPPDPTTWLEDHGDYLFRFALLRVSNRTTAEELVQDTLVAALEGRDRFQGRSTVRTWLTGILKHKVLEYLRVRDRIDYSVEIDDSKKSFDMLGGWKINPTDWAKRPDAEFEGKEFLGQLGQCLSKLKDKPRLAFVLHSVDEVESKAICENLGISENNLWVLLYRARVGLRECLEKNWVGGKRAK